MSATRRLAKRDRDPSSPELGQTTRGGGRSQRGQRQRADCWLADDNTRPGSRRSRRHWRRWTGGKGGGEVGHGCAPPARRGEAGSAQSVTRLESSPARPPRSIRHGCRCPRAIWLCFVVFDRNLMDDEGIALLKSWGFAHLEETCRGKNILLLNEVSCFRLSV